MIMRVILLSCLLFTASCSPLPSGCVDTDFAESHAAGWSGDMPCFKSKGYYCVPLCQEEI